MTNLKTLAIAAALFAGATTVAIAQNGPGTGNQPPVAGGAGNSGMGDSHMMHHKMMHHKMHHKMMHHKMMHNSM
jgi:hypothetical protein